MKIVFAPDFRRGVSYQKLLAEELEKLGIEVLFYSCYRRLMPLCREWRSREWDLFHLHWPEIYFKTTRDFRDEFRKLRFPWDLKLARKGRPLVLTAHNLLPHQYIGEPGIQEAFQRAYQQASRVVVHSARAAELVEEMFRFPRERMSVIPHGDLSPVLPSPVLMEEARRVLSIRQEKVCLMPGVVDFYKGVEEVLGIWRDMPPGILLAVVGKPENPEIERRVRELAQGIPQVRLELERQSEERFAQWLDAADVALFNYRQILTSGSASLARARGVPILIRRDLDAVDLGEPSPLVRRFESVQDHFESELEEAFRMKHDPVAGEAWRKGISWEKVARSHLECYREVLR